MDRSPLERAEVVARDVARRIKAEMPPGWGFFLALSSFGPGGHLTYLSSLERQGAVKLLRELADKLERREPSL